MMDSLRSASRNTMFESWLESAMAGGAVRSQAEASSSGAPSQVMQLCLCSAQALILGGSLLCSGCSALLQRAGDASCRGSSLHCGSLPACAQASQSTLGTLPDIAPYLPPREAPSSPDASTFRPGWEVRCCPCWLLPPIARLCSNLLTCQRARAVATSRARAMTCAAQLDRYALCRPSFA